MASMKLKDIFAGLPVNIFMGGRTDSNYRELDPDEADAVRRAFRKAIDHMEIVAPKLAARFAPQEEAFVKWGGVAKAIFPEERPISYPAVAGTIGVDILTPALYMYGSTSAQGATGQYDYCGYDCKIGAGSYSVSQVGKTWDITLTCISNASANTTQYLAGGSSTFYRANGADQNHQFTVLAENGILEFNSQASISQMLIQTEAATQYSPMSMSPFTEFPVEKETQIYQYQTPGMIPLWHNFGTRIAVLPTRPAGTGTSVSTIPLFGMTFYEQGLYTALK